MFRRTKIVATLGPASSSPDMLSHLLEAGVDVLRLNFSHLNATSYRQLVSRVRTAIDAQPRHVAIMADLQGPKIRIGSFASGAIELADGDAFTLDCDLDDADGSQQAVGVGYQQLAADCRVDDILLLDDGLISLRVEAINANAIACRVINGGTLTSHKGINRQGGGLSAPALTTKDKQDIKLAAALDVDFLALSFPRNATDVEAARRLFKKAGGRGALIAKIERAEAVASRQVLDDLIIAADGVMVARGDLAVEIGDAELIAVQKQIIKRARVLGRFVITATQMMESMIHSTRPTRAEVSDVANAVLDGTDAVMLSAESAVGDHPALCVATMAELIDGAERSRLAGPSPQLELTPLAVTETAIAAAAMLTAYRLDGIVAIAALTDSGNTPLMMSRLRSGFPIFALTRHKSTLRRLAIVRGIMALDVDFRADSGRLTAAVIARLREVGDFKPGDKIIITHGDADSSVGGTNTMRVVTVPASEPAS